MDLNSLGLLFLRVGFSACLFFQHGLPKLLSFSSARHTFPDLIGVGSTLGLALVIFAELVCPVAIFFGFLTRLAVLPTLIAMMVAVFFFHSEDPFSKKEMAVLYGIPMLTLLCTGAGRYSFDKFFLGK